MVAGSDAILSIRDRTNETGNFKLPSYQIDAANLATWLTGWGALKTAIADITEGVLADEQVTIYRTQLSAAIPASNSAQRERKFLVRFTGDVTGKQFRRSIPTADLNAVTLSSGQGGFSDFVLLQDGGVMAAFVSAFEAIARSPDDQAEEVTITSVEHIGTNS